MCSFCHSAFILRRETFRLLKKAFYLPEDLENCLEWFFLNMGVKMRILQGRFPAPIACCVNKEVKAHQSMVVHCLEAFNSSAWVSLSRSAADFCEFQASLFYTVNSKPGSGIE